MNAGITRQENTPSKLELEVVGGFHSGVSLALGEGVYSIGSTPDADIVLRDAGVASEHALLRHDRHGMRIEAMGGDLGIGGELITQGHGCKLRLPVEIVMGDARLRLSNPNGKDIGGELSRKLEPVGRFLLKRPFVAAGGLIMCALAASAAMRDVSAVKVPESMDQPLIPGTKVRYPGDMETLNKLNGDEKVTQSTIKEAASNLFARLKALNINSLKVNAVDKRIMVTGNLTTHEAQAWTSAQQWFDETYSGRVVLTANIAIGENKDAPKLRLQAVWLGERPYIIVEEGRRLYEGARLEDGWVLQRIADDRTILEKDGTSLVLTYR